MAAQSQGLTQSEKGSGHERGLGTAPDGDLQSTVGSHLHRLALLGLGAGRASASEPAE